MGKLSSLIEGKLIAFDSAPLIYYIEEQTMTINVSLTAEGETKLRQRAASLGKDLPAVASDLLEEAVRRASVDELLAGGRKQVSESGMKDEELDAFFRDVLQEVRDEKKDHSK